LIYRMAGENRWGAPRIYSELLMLGFDDVSEATCMVKILFFLEIQ
jgi:hypothetical protein